MEANVYVLEGQNENIKERALRDEREGTINKAGTKAHLKGINRLKTPPRKLDFFTLTFGGQYQFKHLDFMRFYFYDLI
ncbi:MAG TPA: hypothetical protein VK119_03335 [Bacillota bacterium]|nr:hypothetical protein [Bacillota bacterium]